MENKLVTIIIPAYNVERYIRKCLESIEHQTYNNLEIIVVDDLSTDNTAEVVKKMQEEDCRIQLVQLNENGGSAIARQIGIEKSQGDLITFVDADDWYCNKEAVQRVVEVYNDVDVDCVMFGYRTIHKYGIVCNKGFNGKDGFYSIKEVAEAKSCTPSPYWHYLWNKCFRGDLLRSGSVKFHPELRHAEDVRFNADFLRCANSFYVMKNAYFYDYNCTNMNQITREKVQPTFSASVERYEHLKEEVTRLIDDYSLIGASEKAIDGLYKQYYYYVLSLKEKNATAEWYSKLNKIITEDVVYMECVARLGKKVDKIHRIVEKNEIIYKIKKNIKNILKM